MVLFPKYVLFPIAGAAAGYINSIYVGEREVKRNFKGAPGVIESPSSAAETLTSVVLGFVFGVALAAI